MEYFISDCRGLLGAMELHQAMLLLLPHLYGRARHEQIDRLFFVSDPASGISPRQVIASIRSPDRESADLYPQPVGNLNRG